MHSHQSLWTWIPYPGMRLPPFSFNPSPYRRPKHLKSKPTLTIPSVSPETLIHPFIPPPPLYMIFVSNLAGPSSPLTRMISELLILFCHWNSLWISKLVLGEPLMLRLNKSWAIGNIGVNSEGWEVIVFQLALRFPSVLFSVFSLFHIEHVKQTHALKCDLP